MIVVDSRKTLVIPTRDDVLNLMPSVQKFMAHGEQMLAVPHTVQAVRLLRNLGLTEAPSPILHYYDWAGDTPFDSQKVTADLLTTNRRAYVLSEMGVGKTRATLYAIDYLMREGLIHKVLIVAPLSTLVPVWEQEIFAHFPHLDTSVLYGDKKKRLKLLASKADCYIINHEGVGVLHKELFSRTDIDCIVVDELAMYRNSRSVRWKMLAPLVRQAGYAWGLTGSPTPNEPTDAYGQVKLLTPSNVGYSFKAFRDQTMRQITSFRWVAREDALDRVYSVMQPGIRFTRDQCFDLPPTTYSSRDAPMSPGTAAAYKKMLRELAVDIDGEEVTAPNEGVKLGKLLQISSGFVYGGDGKAHYIGGLSRIREVFDIVEEATGKVIIFAPYRFQVELLYSALRRRYSVEMIHGNVPKPKRNEVFIQFQREADPHVLVAHPATMSHGLTLTSAATVVWFAPITSLERYEQANARITRAGQKQDTHVIHITASPAESKVYARLKNKAKMQGALLELFQQP